MRAWSVVFIRWLRERARGDAVLKGYSRPGIEDHADSRVAWLQPSFGVGPRKLAGRAALALLPSSAVGR